MPATANRGADRRRAATGPRVDRWVRAVLERKLRPAGRICAGPQAGKAGGVTDERDGTRSAGAVRDGRPRGRYLPGHRRPTGAGVRGVHRGAAPVAVVGTGGVHHDHAVLRLPRRRGVGLRDARTGRDGLPGVDLLDRDRPAGADRATARRVPRRPERLRVGPHVRARRRGDPDRDAHGVPHQGAARRGGREAPRDRGRPADPEQPGCLRHRDRSEGSGGLMAGKVFFSVSMSLDGFIAPESLEDLMGQQWVELQQWIFPQRFFRENLKLGESGEEGRDNDILRETHLRTGASVMGKRMFDGGEQAWPEEAPFHTPVFVVTHEKRDPWERPGGTAFHFVNDGIESALDQAREAAGDRDVRVAGGGETILEHVNAGLIDEFSVALSPVLFGAGIRLFEGVDAARVALEQVRAEPTERATHLTYAVRER